MRLRPDVPFRLPSVHIQNVIARWQCETIISISVRCYTRDFFFAVLAQDDQRIFGIICTAERWRVSLGKLNIFERNDPQPSFEEIWRSVVRCQTANRKQREATQNQVFEMHNVQKMGGIDSHHPAQATSKLYGSVSFQALRPCVAAYRTRELGTMVRPATSTMGRPVPAVAQSVEALGNLMTPKSLET